MALYVCYRIAEPFLNPIFAAIVLAIVFYPLVVWGSCSTPTAPTKYLHLFFSKLLKLRGSFKGALRNSLTAPITRTTISFSHFKTLADLGGKMILHEY